MGIFSRKKKSATPAQVTKESATQLHLLIAEIKDNVLVLKDGSVRAIVKVNSINFELMSEQEQNIIIYSYQEFLNTLEFPIQILIRSTKLDIEAYLESMEKIANVQQDELLKRQTYEYIDFIGKLVEMSDIMQKDFYVIIPHAPLRAQKPNPVKRFFHALNPTDSPQEARIRGAEFASLKKTLNQRVLTVRDGLSRCSLNSERLSTEQIIELFFSSYNPRAAQHQKVNDLSQLNIPLPTHADGTEEETNNT